MLANTVLNDVWNRSPTLCCASMFFGLASDKPVNFRDPSIHPSGDSHNDPNHIPQVRRTSVPRIEKRLEPLPSRHRPMSNPTSLQPFSHIWSPNLPWCEVNSTSRPHQSTHIGIELETTLLISWKPAAKLVSHPISCHGCKSHPSLVWSNM